MLSDSVMTLTNNANPRPLKNDPVWYERIVLFHLALNSSKLTHFKAPCENVGVILSDLNS